MSDHLLNALQHRAEQQRLRLQKIYAQRCIREAALAYCREGDAIFTTHELFKDGYPPECVINTVKRRAAELRAEITEQSVIALVKSEPEFAEAFRKLIAETTDPDKRKEWLAVAEKAGISIETAAAK